MVYLSLIGSETFYEGYLVDLTNALRMKDAGNGVQSLRVNPKLSKTAKDYSLYLLNNMLFSHFSLDGKSVDSRAVGNNYNYQHVGENLGVIKTNQNDFVLDTEAVDSLFDGWVKSAEHYKNIISPNFDEVGVGFSLGNTSDTTTPIHLYGVVVFGREFAD